METATHRIQQVSRIMAIVMNKVPLPHSEQPYLLYNRRSSGNKLHPPILSPLLL
jgi:hypothetical protein